LASSPEEPAWSPEQLAEAYLKSGTSSGRDFQTHTNVQDSLQGTPLVIASPAPEVIATPSIADALVEHAISTPAQAESAAPLDLDTSPDSFGIPDEHVEFDMDDDESVAKMNQEICCWLWV
jgi:hypothetical protein